MINDVECCPLLITLVFHSCVRDPVKRLSLQNERVADLEEKNSTLQSLNDRLDAEVSALRDQRELAQVCAYHVFLPL